MYIFIAKEYTDIETTNIPFASPRLATLKKNIKKYHEEQCAALVKAGDDTAWAGKLLFNSHEPWFSVTEGYFDVIGWIQKVKVIKK